MKALALFGTMILAILSLTAVKSDGGSAPTHVKPYEGPQTLELGYKVKYKKIFKVFNPTAEAVRIQSIKPGEQCECIVPIWTTGQIKPGKFGLVMVVFPEMPRGTFEVPLRISFYNKEELIDESLTQNIIVEGSFENTKADKTAPSS